VTNVVSRNFVALNHDCHVERLLFCCRLFQNGTTNPHLVQVQNVFFYLKTPGERPQMGGIAHVCFYQFIHKCLADHK